MKKFDFRPTLPLILSIALGFAAVLMVRNYLTVEQKAITKGLEPVRIVVARQNVSADTPISMDMLATRPVPKNFVHANAIYPEEVDLIMGRELLYPVRSGDPILWMDFKGGERYRGFSSMIKEGERALSLKVEDTSNISGLLQPGDHIDILGTFRPQNPGSQDPETTLTLLQNVVVLATGQVTSARSGTGRERLGAGLLTVLVTPEEAALLIHAQQVGVLYNVLRNPEDIESLENLPKVTFSDILQPKVREQIQTARDSRILVIRGGAQKRERVE
ncbi:MAG: Flp pilus assembly protein CpaB [bacterium]